MPPTRVYYYADDHGAVPVLEWLRALVRRQPRAAAKCNSALRQLEALGHELRRPTADYLEQGIYELRARLGRTNYRILYAFHRHAAVLLNAFTKENRIPAAVLVRAVRRLRRFLEDPNKHAHEKENLP